MEFLRVKEAKYGFRRLVGLPRRAGVIAKHGWRLHWR